MKHYRKFNNNNWHGQITQNSYFYSIAYTKYNVIISTVGIKLKINCMRVRKTYHEDGLRYIIPQLYLIKNIYIYIYILSYTV